MIAVGPWTPDSPDFKSQGSLEALNVVPGKESYRPFPSFATFSSNGLAARCQGGTFIRRLDGTGALFVGDATTLDLLSQATFSNVSRVSGGAYATPADGRWNFTEFGDNVIALNGFDVPQVFNADGDSHFSALPGGPPVAKYGCVAGDFLVLANLNNGRFTVQWSGINNISQWTQSVTTQSDSQVLPDGGFIQGMAGYEYAATILQEFAIRRMTYVGPPGVFQFSKIADGIGATIDGSIASYNDKIFFVDRTGFFMIQGGVSVVPIGSDQVNRFFWNNVDQTQFGRVNAAIDPVNSLYIISYPDANAIAGNPNCQLSFNWDTGWWARQQPTGVEMIFSGATQAGYTLEGLDAISTNLDALPFSLDSYVYSGVARKLVCGFDTNHKLGFFNGTAMAATIDTTEDTIGDSKLALVKAIRPIVDGGTPTVYLGTRDRIEDPVSWSSGSVMDAYGRCHFRVNSRYQRARITIPAGATWTHCQGIDGIEARIGGRR